MACVDAGCKRLFAARLGVVCREVGRERLGIYRGFAHARRPDLRRPACFPRGNDVPLGRWGCAARAYPPASRSVRRPARRSVAGGPGLSEGIGGPGRGRRASPRADRWACAPGAYPPAIRSVRRPCA